MRSDPFQDEYDLCNTGTNEEKATMVSPFPDLIDIEISGGRCNLTCPMCPVGRKELTRSRGFMKPELFAQILYELDKHKTPIRLIGWGEPMLHPSFWELVRWAKLCELKVHANTNGYFLKDVGEKIDSIKLSIHENSTEVMEGLVALGEMDCYRHVSMTDKEEIVFVAHPNNYDKISKYKTREPGRDLPRPKNCPEVFNKLTILWDSRVSACCGDADGQMVVGDLKTESLEQIWNSRNLKDFRNLILLGKHFEVLPVCKSCFDLGAT